VTATAVEAEELAAGSKGSAYLCCHFSTLHLLMAAAPSNIILILLVIKGRSFNSSVSIQISVVAIEYAYNILKFLHFQACARSRSINLQYHKVD
jgi:hypothetical protein